MKTFMNRWYSAIGDGGGADENFELQDGSQVPVEGEEEEKPQAGPTDEELDQAAYERLQQRHGYLFQPPAPEAKPQAAEPVPTKETWEMTPQELADMGADQGVRLTTAVLNNRDDVMEALAEYDPEVRKAARTIMNGMTAKDLAHKDAPKLVLRLALGDAVLSGKAVKTKAPAGRGADAPTGGNDDIGDEASFAAKQMGVSFTKAELRAAGIGGRN